MANKTDATPEEELMKENEKLAQEMEAQKKEMEALLKEKEEIEAQKKELESKLDKNPEELNLEPIPTKMVKIKLFKDGKDYKDDVTVGVNGKFYKIQRGVEVKVPDFVAEVLENQERQDSATRKLIADEVSRGEKVNEM